MRQYDPTHHKMNKLLFGPLLFSIGALLLACNPATPTPSATPSPTPSVTPTPPETPIQRRLSLSPRQRQRQYSERWRSAVITRGGLTINWDPKQGVQSGSSKGKRGYERPDESTAPP